MELNAWTNHMTRIVAATRPCRPKRMMLGYDIRHAEIAGVLKPDWWRQSGHIRQGQFRERFVVVDMMGVGR